MMFYVLFTWLIVSELSMIVAKDWASIQIAGVFVFLCKLVKCFLLFDVFVRSCVPFEAFSITKDLNLTNA